MNWIAKAYKRLQDDSIGLVPGVKAAKEVQEELIGYYDDRLTEAEEMTGYNPYIQGVQLL